MKIMVDIAIKVNSIICIDTMDEPVFVGLSDVGSDNSITAVRGYLQVVKTLALAGKSLADYLRDVYLFSDNTTMVEFIKHGREECRRLICHDLKILRQLCEVSACDIKEHLSQAFGQSDILNYPNYENGEFQYDFDFFDKQMRQGGVGIFGKYRTFSIAEGKLVPSKNPDLARLDELKRYDFQKQQVMDNTESFIADLPAQNVLLYGDRGTGKSSTVKALPNEYPEIRLIAAKTEDLPFLSDLYEQLKEIPLKFIIFFDDLTFERGNKAYGMMKSALEGSVVAKPSNVLIYATTNRRHFVKESNADRDRDVFHRGDDLDDNVSLADRFGLYLTYSVPNKDLYLQIVQEIAIEKQLDVPIERLLSEAERFALKRGGRSPRIAKQCVEFLLTSKGQ